jgi:hypothetical protein
MACINKNKLPYLITYDPNNPRLLIVEGSSAVSARTDETFDYYYIQFSCANSFRIYDIEKIIPSDVLLKIRNQEVFLVLDNGLEPFFESADGIYNNLVLTKKIPAKQIIFMASAPTMIDHVRYLSKKLNEEEINVEWFSLFEYQLWDVISHQLTVPLDTLTFKKYDKKFINFNRRWRLHRPLMILLLKDRGLLDSGFVSLGVSDYNQDTWNYRLSELLTYYSDKKEILEIIQRNLDIKNLSPMYLDTNDLRTNRAEQTSSTDRYYLNSYFSVVNETTYHTNPGYDGVPFLSEKIFKCIAMKHPFIMVSAPNSLQYLRELGYKTFNNLIDESYDSEIDDGLRILKIVDEIERLVNLSDNQLQDFLIEAKEICDFNYKILKDKKNFIRRMN